MHRGMVLTLVLLSVTLGVVGAEAGNCLPVWLDTQGQAAECGVARLQDQLKQNPRVCLAASREKAVARVRLTRCVEQVAAAAAPPGSAVAGHEFVIRAEVTEGNAVKELAGHGSDSWASAVQDLCRAITVWHGDRTGSK